MSDYPYREEILELWNNPLNFGELEFPTVTYLALNKYCGDKIKVTINISNNYINDIKFNGESCAISRASASLFTEYIKGKSVKDILALPFEDFLEITNTPIHFSRMKCSVLIHNAVSSALTSLQS